MVVDPTRLFLLQVLRGKRRTDVAMCPVLASIVRGTEIAQACIPEQNREGMDRRCPSGAGEEKAEKVTRAGDRRMVQMSLRT